jgi:hypothetical protein
LNNLNDGLAYALEARNFENFHGMVNKTLVLENHKGVIERKRKLVRQHQPSSSSKPRVATSSAGPVFRPTQPQFQPRPQAARQGFSTLQLQVIQHPNNLQTLAARNQSIKRTKLPKTHNKLTVGAITVVNRNITAIDASIRALMSISLL